MNCQYCTLPEHLKIRSDCLECRESEALWCGKAKHKPQCPFTNQLRTSLSEEDMEEICSKRKKCLCCNKWSFSLIQYGKLKYCRDCVYQLNRILFFNFDMTLAMKESFPKCWHCDSENVFHTQGHEQTSVCQYPMFYNWDYDKQVYELRKEHKTKEEIVDYFQSQGGLLCITCRDLCTFLAVDEEPFNCEDCKRSFKTKCLKRRWMEKDVCLECYFSPNIQQAIVQHSQIYDTFSERCCFPNCIFCDNTSKGCQFDHNNMFVYSEFDQCSSPGMSILKGAPTTFIIDEIKKCSPICFRMHDLTSVIEREMGYFRAKKTWKRLPLDEGKVEILKKLKDHYDQHFQSTLAKVTDWVRMKNFEVEEKKNNRCTAQCPDCKIVFPYMKSNHRGSRRNKCPLQIPNMSMFRWTDHVYKCWSKSIPNVIQEVTGYDEAMRLLHSIEPTNELIVQKRFEWELWFQKNFLNWNACLNGLVTQNTLILDQHRYLLSGRKRQRDED